MMNPTKENIRKFLGWCTVINMVLQFFNLPHQRAKGLFRIEHARAKAEIPSF